MTSTLEAMTDRFASLPEDTQKALRRFEYDKALRALHAKYKLHIDQAAALEENVASIIFGEKKSTELIASISRDLHIGADQARTIAFDINDTILRPIQELMKQEQAEENDASVLA